MGRAEWGIGDVFVRCQTGIIERRGRYVSHGRRGRGSLVISI